MKVLSIIVSHLFCLTLLAQNLVPNSSFELKNNCPFALSQLYFTKYWYCPQYYNSTDYFNACTTSNHVNIPENQFGFQHSSTGKAYAGFTFYNMFPDYREYISVKLINSLKVNQNTRLIMFVSLANNSKFSISKKDVGVYFSNDSSNMPGSYGSVPLPFVPQIVAGKKNEYLSDSLNWVKLEFNYKAKGGEQFITIGNFNYDSTTNYQVFNSNGIIPAAYYYIDDVSLYRVYNKDVGIFELNHAAACYGSTDPLQVKLTNTGLDSLDFKQNPLSLIAKLSINGTVKQTVSQQVNNNQLNPIAGNPLPPDSSIWVSMAPFDFSHMGANDSVSVEVTVAGDEDSSNNVLDTVLVIDFGHCAIEIPNIFTPNGDGVNDLFVYRNVTDKVISSKIYNRWGGLVSQWQGNSGWDGAKVDDGVYYYIVVVDGVVYKGEITLVR